MKSSREYWRSLDELAGTPEFQEFMEREFPPGASEMLSGPTRRQFLKVMGASLALAGLGLTGCRWPREEIMPYAHRPEGSLPGVPKQYATAMELAGVATGLLVTSYDGRPVKIEGNPSHPFSLGASDATTQATVLELYDPDRSKHPVERAGGKANVRSYNDFIAFAGPHFASLKENRGAGFAVLCEATSSPSVVALRAQLGAAYPQAKWYEYEAVSDDNERAGAAVAFGKPYRTQLEFSHADVIVSLDHDFLRTHPAWLKYARDFAAGRRADSGKMNRLYVAESTYSITGTQADHRITIKSGEVASFAAQLAQELFINRGLAPPGESAALSLALKGFAVDKQNQAIIEAIAGDLMAHRERSIVTAGPRQSPEVHALAHLINKALGNTGHTLNYTPDPEPGRPSHAQAIAQLAGAMNAGEVSTLLILGGNPAYDAPVELDFAAALGKVDTSIHLSLYDDETSHACSWHAPRAHYLESWGDARAYDGTVSIVQPLIEPLYQGKSIIEVLSLIVDQAPLSGYETVRRTRSAGNGFLQDFEASWNRALHDGVVADSSWPLQRPGIRPASIHAALSEYKQVSHGGGAGLEIVFTPDPHVYDGRFANNGWLQEAPDPLSKITWDNVACIGPETAKELKVEHGSVVRLELGGRELTAPVYVMPGQARGSVSVALGYGRKRSGRVGTDTGFDAYKLRTSAARDFSSGLQVSKLGKKYKLATTQDHHAIDTVGYEERSERAAVLIREGTFEQYKADPSFAQHMGHHTPLNDLWKAHEYKGHKWGMAIDLNSCIGCGACIVACQAENNIPVVGKEQVYNGREMHWIRVDRYFSGDVEEPKVTHQPLTCQHCENAPCEQVCPVAATLHSDEGLNEMVYNRCIGTRYCSNNCPYKVRRFNYFNYRKRMTEVEKMATNPDVTVRSRGVMEKCTFCVQRIQAVKIVAKNEGRQISDGEIVPACAQACPVTAITFGDLNDPVSEVRRMHDDYRAYSILDELKTLPRTRYLAKLNNPAPGVAGLNEHTNGGGTGSH